MALPDYRCLLAAPTRELTKEEMMCFTGLVVDATSGDGRGAAAAYAQAMVSEGGLRILSGMLDGLQVKVSTPLRLWIAMLCESPGHCRLWTYTLRLIQRESGGKEVDLVRWADFFPDGVPSEDGLSEAWANQKDPASPKGNWLDSQEAWALP